MAIRIVFVGKNKAGKTWAADYLRLKHNFKKEAFNDGLADILRKLYYYGDHQRIRWEVKIKFYDALYKIDPNIWAGYMERRLRTTTRDVVIDDVRYLNEVAVLKTLGFYVIRISAPEERRRRKLHSYKTAADGLLAIHDLYNRDFDNSVGVDYSIFNDSKEDTRLILDQIVERLRFLDNEKASSA
jgi:hypothetical protein